MKKVTLYKIYVKNKCLFDSIEEDEFSVTWKTLNNLVDLICTDYKKEDLFYEKIEY